ncbi:MAG: efflux RND transporter periplasmic adaptor subunit [Thiobacillaceae bacterium]
MILALVIGVLAGRYWPGKISTEQGAGTQAATGLDSLSPVSATQTGAKHRHTFVCPMHPEIVQDHEGQCPICGMDLVAADSADEHEAHNSVSISPEVTNNLSVHLATTQRRDMTRSARLPAYIQGFTPGLTQVIRGHLAGTVARIRPKAGSWVHAGDVLFEIQVPGAKQVQEGHLEVLKRGDAKAIDESRMQLRELGLTGDDIKMLEAERKPVEGFSYIAPMDGQVTNITHPSGDQVKPGDAILVLQGRGETSVDVDIFQSEALWLKSGDKAEMRVRQLPNQVWKGEVAMEGIRTNPEKRTYGLRLVFPMSQGVLSNDMFGEVIVIGVRKRNALAIPREALIRTENKNRVMVAQDNGHFAQVEVQPGVEDGDFVEILSGLKDGDRVVVSSQFLLDSESSMRAEIHRMTGEEIAGAAAKPADKKMSRSGPMDHGSAHTR